MAVVVDEHSAIEVSSKPSRIKVRFKHYPPHTGLASTEWMEVELTTAQVVQLTTALMVQLSELGDRT